MTTLRSLFHFQKIRSTILAHKIISSIALVAVLGGGYFLTTKKATAQVTLQDIKVVQKTITSSVTGTGTITPTNTITLKAKGSGDIRSISVKAGDSVRQGARLVSLDATNALQAVQTAKVNLETAQLELDKIKQPADSLAVLQLKDQIATAEQAIKDQDTAVTNARRTLLNAGLQAVPEAQSTSAPAPLITGSYLGSDEGQIKLTIYQSGNGLRFIATGLAQGDGLASLTTPQPLGTSGLYVTFGTLDAQPNWLINIPNKTAAAYLNAYTAYQNALTTKDKTVAAQQRTLAELNAQMDKLQAGAEPLDIRAKELIVAQRQNELADANTKLSDYYVFAPFDGIIAGVTGEVGDSVGPSTSLGTIITNKEVAEISLNEVDIAKVSVGQKATLTFDAIDGLTVSGTIAQIDTIGTTVQGVVTYKVEILFDDKSKSIKPGMTVSADIELERKDNALVVPNEAVKKLKGKKFVEVRTAGTSTTATKQVEIVTGIVNDTETEVVSGLDKDSSVVVRRKAITATAAAAPSLLGGGAGGAGAFRGGARTGQ